MMLTKLMYRIRCCMVSGVCVHNCQWCNDKEREEAKPCCGMGAPGCKASALAHEPACTDGV